mmetsp:Transcript_20525/g.64406  ORF Transcript_20525/g.64406 Transcript_20525/m.64406 type:complete len:236 (-) Transcript_20525:954-1661(-)
MRQRREVHHHARCDFRLGPVACKTVLHRIPRPPPLGRVGREPRPHRLPHLLGKPTESKPCCGDMQTLPVRHGAYRQPAAAPRLYLEHGRAGGRLALAPEALAGKVKALSHLIVVDQTCQQRPFRPWHETVPGQRDQLLPIHIRQRHSVLLEHVLQLVHQLQHGTPLTAVLAPKGKVLWGGLDGRSPADDEVVQRESVHQLVKIARLLRLRCCQRGGRLLPGRRAGRGATQAEGNR